jgi:hypothetical protein
MSLGIQQTREVVQAVGAVAVRLIDDLKDGKVSLAEGLGFLADFNVIRAGIQGVGTVPAELADLSDEEREVLLVDINAMLTAAGLSHRIADAAEKILRWAYGTVQVFVELRNAPPSAVAV